jgi:MFS family permease
LSERTSETGEVKHDPLAILRQRNFDLYLSSRVLSGIGSTMLQAVFLWHVHELTESALSLGLLGLMRFFPALALSLVGGAVADAYNRRVIILCAQTVPLTAGILIAAATRGGWIQLEMIYGVAFCVGLAQAFEGPSNTALLPSLVSREDFPHAVNVSSTSRSLGAVTGPFLAGLVLAIAGIGEAYVVYVVVIATSMTLMAFLKYRQQDGPKRAVSVAAIKEGISFVRSRPVILGAMTLDLFAVIFAGATALLPIYAKEILHADAIGYGILLGSYEAGAFVMAFIMVMRPPVVRAGRTLIWSVVAFGICTIIFGFSRWLPLSILAYFMIGATDQISVVMRNAIIQLSTPDELRGRVSAVSSVFIQSSNQLGAVESGFLAAATSASCRPHPRSLQLLDLARPPQRGGVRGAGSRSEARKRVAFLTVAGAKPRRIGDTR